MNERINVQIQDGVADVRLSRVDKMNALDADMFSALIDTGERLKADSGVRAVVLSGEGRAFCAGLDMGNFAKMASGDRNPGVSSAGCSLLADDRTAGGSNRAQHAVMVWREVPVPVIAAVHGVAFGGGFQLTLGADMRFATADARFSVMEIRWGLVPDMGGMVLMRGLIRDDQVRDLTFSGRQITGHEAFQMGLVTRLCDDPRAEALAYAADIAGKSPTAIRAAKRLLALAAHADQTTLLLAESQEQTKLMGSPAQVEAVKANLEKRTPVFHDA